MTGDAFQQLLLAEIDAVYRLACHLSHARSEVDDVVQETFLRAIKSAKTFTLTPDYGIRPWLFKILHNVLHTRHSKSQRERSVLKELQQQTPTATLDAVAPAADSTAGADADCTLPFDWEHIDQRLKRAIGELPLPFREAFLLSAVEGLKYRQIAEVIDAPIGTVMSRLARARGMLNEKLKDLAIEQRLIRTEEATDEK